MRFSLSIVAVLVGSVVIYLCPAVSPFASLFMWIALGSLAFTLQTLEHPPKFQLLAPEPKSFKARLQDLKRDLKNSEEAS